MASTHYHSPLPPYELIPTFNPFPSSPLTHNPLTQPLKATTSTRDRTANHDNRLAVSPFKQTPDERHGQHGSATSVGVRANHTRDGGQAGGSAHGSGHAAHTGTYRPPDVPHPYPVYPTDNTSSDVQHIPTPTRDARVSDSRASSTTGSLATRSVCHDNVGTGVVPSWGASPNFTNYASLQQHQEQDQFDPECDHQGGAPDASARSGRDALVLDPARRRPPFGFEEETYPSHHHQSRHVPLLLPHTPCNQSQIVVVGESTQSSTELASSSLSASRPGSTTFVTPAADLLVGVRHAVHVDDAPPAATTDPRDDLYLSVPPSRQLATPIRNTLDIHDARHGLVSLSANFNSLDGLGNHANGSCEHGEARLYMGGRDGMGDSNTRPSRSALLLVPSPPPAPPTTVLTTDVEEERYLLEAFFESRSRVLKIIHPSTTVPSGLSLIIQCVSRVTTAMRDSCTSSPIVYTARPASRFPPSPLFRPSRSPLLSGSHSSIASPAPSSAGLLSPYSPYGAGGLKTPEDVAAPLRPRSAIAQDGLEDEVYVMFASHEEASHAMDVALAMPSLGLSVAPALMSDLDRPGVQIYLDEYQHKMSGNGVHVPVPITDAFFKSNTTLKPPLKATNGRVTAAEFRAGDWICTVHGCKTHNFSRNMVCYGCGNMRHAPLANDFHPPLPPPTPTTTTTNTTAPRFAAAAPPTQRTRPYPPPPPPMDNAHGQLPSPRDPAFPHTHIPAKPPAPSYPLLTPSGQALASGGRVRNISVDPLNPCVMYWPDNEPLPERGQIRPTGSVVVQYPPIINTGNKGAAEKQPGDWVCSKCSYLNWRRRKVCQTCYPYAEGNGDSISQAVQAERIALLTNVLNQVNDPVSPLPLPLHQFSSFNQQQQQQQPSPLSQQFGLPGVPQQQQQQLPPHLHRRASAPLNSHHHPSSPFAGHHQNFQLPQQYGGIGGGNGPTTPAPVPTLNGSAAARARSQNDLRGLLRSEHQLQQYQPDLREDVHNPRMGLHHHRSTTAIYQTAQNHSHPAQHVQNGFIGNGYGSGYASQRSPTGTSSTRSHGSRVPSPTSSSGHGFALAEEEHSLGLSGAGGDTGVTPSAPSLLPGFLQDMVKVQGSSNGVATHSNRSNASANGSRASQSIHSSPSTSTSESSWSLDEFDSPSSLAFDHPRYPHRQQVGGGASAAAYEPFAPAYEYVESSLSLFPSQVSLGPRVIGGNGISSGELPNSALGGQQGPGVIGRPPRLSRNTSSATSGNGVYVARSNSSGSVASLGGRGALSIWQMDGEEREEEEEVKADEVVAGTWKPASTIGGGGGVYSGQGRGLGGLEDLAARLTISNSGARREVGV